MGHHLGAEVLLDVAVEIVLVSHRRQRVNETEQLRAQLGVPHRPPHQPFRPRGDPEGPRLRSAPELGDLGGDRPDLSLGRCDTPALISLTLRHFTRR